jgi:GT2 family glycosyltransferase/ADP-heptose:LPS heptosyltransferase
MSTTDMARAVTLYVPCRNAEEFIAGCLESVLGQSHRPAEILVVNDASTDRTAEIAARYPVRVIHLPFHPGLAAARNEALRAARHEYVASIDVDCTVEHAWLERLMDNLTEPSVAGAGGTMIERHDTSLADRWRATHMRQNWGATRIVNPPFLFGCNTLFRKRALEEVGGYDPRFSTNGEDVDISLRLRDKSYTLIYDPRAAVFHLKQDTIASALRADWRWGYASLEDKLKWEHNSRIVYHNFANAKYRFLQDTALGRYSLLPMDLLLFFAHTYYDLIHKRRLGLGARSGGGLGSRVETLTAFHDHLARLSEAKFLRSPVALDAQRRIGMGRPRKILFAVFGAMGDIFNALPIVKALRGKYPDAEITWLTLPRYREIAECPWVDRVITRGTGRHGDLIPAEMMSDTEYDLVLFPQGSFHQDEWQQLGLHMVDFMAWKCGVKVASRAPEVASDPATREAVETFWTGHALERQTTVAMACTALSCKPWPLERFKELAARLRESARVATVHIGGEQDPPLPGAIDCRGMTIRRGMEIIRRCNLFIGCDSGPSWMASCTDTPMIVFMDMERQRSCPVGFADIMPEKDITELPHDASVDEVMGMVLRRLKEARAR